MTITTMIICFPRKETCFCRGEERSKVLVGVLHHLMLSTAYNVCIELSMRKKAPQMKEETETGEKKTKEKEGEKKKQHEAKR